MTRSDNQITPLMRRGVMKTKMLGFQSHSSDSALLANGLHGAKSEFKCWERKEKTLYQGYSLRMKQYRYRKVPERMCTENSQKSHGEMCAVTFTIVLSL